MVTRISHCFITVHDQDEALAFYRDLVGLEVRADLPIGSMRWLTVAAPGEPDGIEISLETPEGRSGDEAALSRVMAAGSLTAAIFQTADCDQVFERAFAGRLPSDPGPDRPALRRARLRCPRPVGEYGALLPAVGAMTAGLAPAANGRGASAFERNRRLLRAKDHIDSRYSDELSVSDLAAVAGISRAHFIREFRRAFGEPPHQYLLSRRLERAASMLRLTDEPITDICHSVGLRSVGSFTTSFTRAFGQPPHAYRASRPPLGNEAWIPACIVRTWLRPHVALPRREPSE